MRKDVAKAAGVSESAVTRTLNGGYVSPSVRERVMLAIETLNYKPNALARALRTGRTQQIACISPAIDNPFFSEVIRGIEEIAIDHGYILSIYSSQVIDRRHETFLLPGRYDGVILLSPSELNSWLVQELAESHIPLATFWDWGSESPYPSVAVDLVTGVEEVIAHLFSQGHQRIGYLGYLPSAETDVNPRLLGFRRAFVNADVDRAPYCVELVAGFGTMEEGYAGASRLFRNYAGLTAVFASNDMLAFGAMKWLRENGYDVPRQVSVVGCDDTPFCTMSNPSLSTIQIPKRDVGQQLMQLVLKGQRNTDLTVHVTLPSRLIVRESSGPAL
ncbi:MAG: LacI family DNA-binding transcriptional regulator [Firmicutes bacterium]|nr:LacI family DNA-binding transcriptional regulator [Bacillota bacterium]